MGLISAEKWVPNSKKFSKHSKGKGFLYFFVSLKGTTNCKAENFDLKP